ncbi:MAG: hypothetical protein J5I47_04670 [Vicingus serpentipes]|nr:hypothetical protein [Vicingus serpentipes]
MSKEKVVGTIYKGKELHIQIPGISHNLSRTVTDVYVQINVPSGVEFKDAKLEYGIFDSQNSLWHIPSIFENQAITGDFFYTVTDECKSKFSFSFNIKSVESCSGCINFAYDCIDLIGYSCCDIANCNFTRLSAGQEDIVCPVDFSGGPLNPPENPLEGEVYIETFQTCYAIWTYENGDWVLNNTPEEPTGSISEITGTIVGHKIATHDNQVDPPVDINETITNYVSSIVGGHQIGLYHREDAGIVDIRETITEINNTVVGHKIADHTSEDGTVEDINETVTDYSNLVVSGNKIGEHTNEEGTVTDVEETITSLAENTDLSLTYTDEAGTPVTSTSPMVKPVRYENTDYVVNGTTDYTIFGGGACESITLPDPALVPEGRIFNIKQGQKTGNFITITAANGGTIDEVASYQFSVIYESISVQRFSTGYLII